MELASLLMLMAHTTMVSGKITCIMARAKKNGPMAHSSKVTTSKVSKMGRVFSAGTMAQVIKVTSHKTVSTARVAIPGLMVVSIMVLGKITKCTERVNIFGLMDANMLDIMYSIRKKAMASSTGPTVDSIKDTGKTASRRVLACTTTPSRKSSMVSGNKARDSSGLRKMSISQD